MAENNEKIPEATVAKEKKAEKKANIFARIVSRVKKFFKDYTSELKKVVWPNTQTVLKNTGTVLLCSLAIGACIWVFDAVAVNFFRMIISVLGG